MNVYQQKMKANAMAAKEIEDYDEEKILQRRLDRIKELQRNPGDDNFARLSTSLHDAAFQGRPDAVKYFIRAMHVPVDDYDTKGYCAIHYSAQNGYIDVTRYLLDVGCDVDVVSEGGVTALMTAAKKNHPDMLEFLFESGCNIAAQDNSGQTAAHYAAQEDNNECIATLYELGLVRQAYELQLAEEGPDIADAVLDDKPLTLIGVNDDKEEDKKKVEDDKEDEEAPPLFNVMQTIETTSKNGGTPLHVAAVFDSRKCIQALIEYDVDVNARDNMMETAMHKAARRNYILAYNMLKAAGGRDTLVNLMGETPADVLVDR
mmetsp:Transcript_11690/g.19056  ORF Transcript_11690/g.19056 Transcript_11690/m.19056 type:complete len:318 (-) Transcript_11690:136-1089(-)|eukprot:CAMPEP_0114414682 /NCGR_PEP_ID=MMETSP0103-20121206/1514_1 /TAXON_ID=37642 ORGANISM="Paraphysomonas imperforata, Strain PA2" /NCGR_SAMPLE_ID=MMETSP0103 /ASSEMBLY_ACC=CAM_ASM_000201 /LENGTH=317 /DNA_ID=CAMNT_0001582831 /DNA_START=77 /DNA_END=1030 /DNA_ORIENTATION=+